MRCCYCLSCTMGVEHHPTVCQGGLLLEIDADVAMHPSCTAEFETELSSLANIVTLISCLIGLLRYYLFGISYTLIIMEFTSFQMED